MLSRRVNFWPHTGHSWLCGRWMLAWCQRFETVLWQLTQLYRVGKVPFNWMNSEE